MQQRTKPFLKWAGGKQHLFPKLRQYLPGGIYFPKFNYPQTYIEPFLGGGSVFFNLKNIQYLPEKAILSDCNSELINAYHVVRDQLDELIRTMVIHRNNHCYEYFCKVKALDRNNTKLSPLERAARTIYLNKTCFNGLYRLNRKGQFNTSWGGYVNPKILDEGNLKAVQKALKEVKLEVIDFREVIKFAKKTDVIYFDPPYQPVSKTSNFTSYTSIGFNETDQIELAQMFNKLTDLGCSCVLSNSFCDFILDLYRDFNIHIIEAKRSINRTTTQEVIITNF